MRTLSKIIIKPIFFIKRTIIFSLLALIFQTLFFSSPVLAQQQKSKEIIGYYPSWQWYKRGGLMHHSNLDYTKYSILNYSFFAPDTAAYIWGTDAWADSVLLRGKIDWGKPQPAYFPNTAITDIAHVWGVKVMVSIGGWTLSDNFPAIAADSIKRARFASQCVHLLRSFKFDGIDIDWEYPGYEEHKGTPDDRANFTLLMQAIRDSIDAYGKKIKYDFLLTGAFGASAKQMDQIEWDQIKIIMDYINLMTYDFNGAWSEETNHNSPLYNPAVGLPGSWDLGFNLLTKTYGVPAEKINMGVAWYGRTFICDTTTTKPGLFTPHNGKSDDKTYAVDEGMPQYFNILLQAKKFNQFWDDTSKVPYMVGKEIPTFVTFDDEKSIRLKADYVMANNCAGVIIWDVTGDYVEKKEGGGMIKGTPLVNVLDDVFKPAKPRKTIKKRWN